MTIFCGETTKQIFPGPKDDDFNEAAIYFLQTTKQ